MSTPTQIAGFIALFTVVGAFFLFIHLLMGKFLRPKNPNAEKLEVYECGEPTIGSSFVQFDIRFYVVALLFIIFDVEIAFFFPWANVFGKATHLKDPNFAVVQSAPPGTGAEPFVSPAALGVFRELGVAPAAVPQATDATRQALAAQVGGAITPEQAAEHAIRSTADTLALVAICDILVFFAVLLVGFAYVWRRGDLDWVRAVREVETPERTPPTTALEREPMLSA